jgi:hypothetical protein
MSSHERNAPARRRGAMHRAQGNRRVGRGIKTRFDLPTRRGGRVGLNGRERGGRDPRFVPWANSTAEEPLATVPTVRKQAASQRRDAS